LARGRPVAEGRTSPRLSSRAPSTACLIGSVRASPCQRRGHPCLVSAGTIGLLILTDFLRVIRGCPKPGLVHAESRLPDRLVRSLLRRPKMSATFSGSLHPIPEARGRPSRGPTQPNNLKGIAICSRN
jgi:hypothetical protein